MINLRIPTAPPLVLALWLIFGCAGPLAQQNLRGTGDLPIHIVVIYDDWHSGIVVKTADLSADILPELQHFPGADYLEFSWGDREYFPHPDPGLGLALKAAFYSSGSIIHVVGVQGKPITAYPHAEVVTVGLSSAGLHGLMKFVSGTFSRPISDSPAEALPGLSENARFYLAEGRFSIFRTCNSWVAEALQAAGLPISPVWVITAGSLGRYVRSLGIVRRRATETHNAVTR